MLYFMHLSQCQKRVGIIKCQKRVGVINIVSKESRDN